MGRYNLLEEKWISVRVDEKGRTEEVSLLELFENAHRFKGLAGETPAQDFAMLRFLLAILHTVFSRFDFEGKAYEYLNLDEKYVQKEEIDEDDLKDYKKDLLDSWKKMWEGEKLPKIIGDYLNLWRDRFNLYDEKYPFYQVTKEELESKGVTTRGYKNTGITRIRQINRLISESGNKIALFSPIVEDYKDELSDANFARWLISYQGYTETFVKAKLPKEKLPEEKLPKEKLPKVEDYKSTKGWLLGIGGIYFSGENLKEILLLNLTRIAEFNIQRPVWEKTFDENLNDILKAIPDNLAELYTNWSRLVYIKEWKRTPKGIQAIGLPGINSESFFLEPMTAWRKINSKKKDDLLVPLLHDKKRSIWRDFGSLTLNRDGDRKPVIIEWHEKLIDKNLIDPGRIKLYSVGYEFDSGNSSKMMRESIFDTLNIHEEVLADIANDGWVPRIIEAIDMTKSVIEVNLKKFAQEIMKIRNISDDFTPKLVDEVLQDAYYEIDLPFREWLAGIEIGNDKDKKLKEWYGILRKIIKNQAYEIYSKGGTRDFLGKNIGKDESSKVYLNMPIAYNKFMGRLNKKLPKEEREKK